jgi:hypothetical protein
VKYLLSQRKYDITFAHSIKDWEIETENMGGEKVLEKMRKTETERQSDIIVERKRKKDGKRGE